MRKALSAVSVLLLVCLCGCGARQAVPQVPDWSGSGGEVGFEESGFLSEPVPAFSEARSEESETASFTPPESEVSAHSEAPPVESEPKTESEPVNEAPPIEGSEDSSEPVESEAPPVSEAPTPPQPEPPSEAPEATQPEPPSAAPVESEPEPHTHSYIETVVPPSCTEQGYTQHRCKCGDCYKDNFVPATGHSWEEWQLIKYPTLDEEGAQEWRCTVCGKKEQRAIPKVQPIDEAAAAEAICTYFIQALNEERAKLGAPPLSTAPIAHEMAMVRAQELTVKFSHTRPDGEDSHTIYRDYKYNLNDGAAPDPDTGEIIHDYAPYYGSEDIGAGGVFTREYDNFESWAKSRAEDWCSGFATSPGHWKDLTDPEYTGVGVGVSFEFRYCSHGVVAYNHYIAVLTMDKTYG